MASPEDQPTTPARTRLGALIALVVAVALIAVGVGVSQIGRGPGASNTPSEEPTPRVVTPRSSLPPGLDRAREVLGEPRSGGAWHSGIWTGGDSASGGRVEEFGDWRALPVDAITMYPATDNWETVRTSTWHIETFADSPAVLAYGLPLLPTSSGDSLADVAAGSADDVFRTIARQLVDNDRDVTIVRIGWEANGDWFPWNATAEQAEDYKAAFRRVATVMKEVSPNFVIDFDIGCGVPLRGQRDRLDGLTLLYPGDDVVDLVGCDTYDWHTVKSTDEASWAHAKNPSNAPGIGDVADFAREHGKGLSYPEWGVASLQEDGVGDNPYFIAQMHAFFEDNADVLVLESYFSEPDTTLANSIWDPVQMPESSQEYRRLWGDR